MHGQRGRCLAAVQVRRLRRDGAVRAASTSQPLVAGACGACNWTAAKLHASCRATFFRARVLRPAMLLAADEPLTASGPPPPSPLDHEAVVGALRRAKEQREPDPRALGLTLLVCKHLVACAVGRVIKNRKSRKNTQARRRAQWAATRRLAPNHPHRPRTGPYFITPLITPRISHASGFLSARLMTKSQRTSS